MNKLSSLEDTKSAQFLALAPAQQAVLLDRFLTEVDKNQTYHINLKHAYEEAKRAGWQDKAAHEERIIANLQAILDEGEKQLDGLLAQSKPAKKAKGKTAKAAPVEDPTAADAEILDLVKKYSNVESGGDA